MKHESKRTKRARYSAMLICSLWTTGAAMAQTTFPTKPVRLILPYAPGGGTSVIGRLVAAKLTEMWKQQVIVDNRPGGNTIIGTEAMLKSPADGYTMLLVTSTHTINPSLLKTPYDPIKDFAPVSTLSRSPFMLVVHPALPVKSLKEFIALAKSRPGQLDFGSSGTGTANHLSVEQLSMVAGIKLNHIPYKGGGPALIDLMGGQVQVHMSVPVNLIQNIRNGRIKGLAVTGESRIAALPDLPTFAEAGLPEYGATNWNGILLAGGTPKAQVDRLNADLVRVLQTADFREKLTSQGQNAWPSTPEQFSALIKSEIETFAKVVARANIKAD